MITEKLLHFIWQYKLYQTAELHTTDNDKLTVVKSGVYNTNEGPDFLMAQIKIDNLLLNGAIEIHIKSSDWYKHKHPANHAYNNVILHVVFENDIDIPGLKTIELKNYLAEDLLRKYSLLNDFPQAPFCKGLINEPNNTIADKFFFERLIIERMYRKVMYIEQLLSNNANDWEKTALQTIAKYLGGNVNGSAFEQLVQTISVNQLRKIADNILAVEAIFFGAANLLNDDKNDEYFRQLKQEYNYYKRLFQLQQNANLKFNFLRLRPVAFPTIRLSQLAAFIHSSPHFFSAIIKENQLQFFEKLFTVTASTYWENHYVFDEESNNSIKKIGKATIYSILINAIVPLKFAYANYTGQEDEKENILQLLLAIPPEKNAIMTKMLDIGLHPRNALESQALLELYQNYCLDKKCLQCMIGKKILTKS